MAANTTTHLSVTGKCVSLSSLLSPILPARHVGSASTRRPKSSLFISVAGDMSWYSQLFSGGSAAVELAPAPSHSWCFRGRRAVRYWLALRPEVLLDIPDTRLCFTAALVFITVAVSVPPLPAEVLFPLAEVGLRYSVMQGLHPPGGISGTPQVGARRRPGPHQFSAEP